MTDTTTYKILLLMKRRPGLSVDEFRDYYENHHVALALKGGGGAITRYVRRYLEPQPDAESGTNEELPYDVVTELWFDDEAAWRGTLGHLTTAVKPRELIEDEERLFDRSSMRIATVVEQETDLAALRRR